MLNEIWAAVLIAAVITLAVLTTRPLISRALLPHGRHHTRRTIARAREDMEADFWLRELYPGRSLAGLRLRRDLRRWIPRGRKLP